MAAFSYFSTANDHYGGDDKGNEFQFHQYPAETGAEQFASGFDAVPTIIGYTIYRDGKLHMKHCYIVGCGPVGRASKPNVF